MVKYNNGSLKALQHLHVGLLYKVDHLRIPSIAPIKDIKVVLVVAKTNQKVVLGYPDIPSLKKHFENPHRMRLPLMQHHYEMEHLYTDALSRVSNEELVCNADKISFWVSMSNTVESIWDMCLKRKWGTLDVEKEGQPVAQKSKRVKKGTKQQQAAENEESSAEITELKQYVRGLTLAWLSMRGSILSTADLIDLDFGSPDLEQVLLQKNYSGLDDQITQLVNLKKQVAQALGLSL